MSVNGQVFSGRGAAKVMRSGVSVAAGVNSDGTAYKTVAAKLVGLDLTFDRGVGLAWDESMLLEDIDATFVEDDVKLTHLFTSASWDGDPTVDTSTGEVSGLKIMTSSRNYQSY